MNTNLRALPPQLPDTQEDFLRNRKLKSERTLNDQIEDIHLRLYETPKYKAFLYAVYDEQAVEGSLSCDNYEAARMVRDQAHKIGQDEVSRSKLATISKCLNVVMRRYGESRKERRNMVGGTIVTPENNGD